MSHPYGHDEIVSPHEPIHKREECPYCDGYGFVDCGECGHSKRCPKCHGQRFVAPSIDSPTTPVCTPPQSK